jgi:HupE / UreJ protein
MLTPKPPRLRPTVIVALVALLSALPAVIGAHTIPNDVTTQAFVKAEGRRLLLLARVPLVALKGTAWPLKAPDILDASRATPVLTDAAMLWLGTRATLFEGSRSLPAPKVAAIRATPSTDRSFETYGQAFALVSGPKAADDITISGGFLDVLFEYPIQSESSRFSIAPQWQQLGKNPLLVIRLMVPGGAIRAYELPGNPGLVDLNPSWTQAGVRFVKLGFEHILSGTDHLLFLFALVIPFRRFRQLLVLITAFTVAHSITLIASAYDLAPTAGWFPPLIEALIAASIVYMTLENMIGASLHRRWMITFGFGLVHGFGFSFALKQTLQFAGAHLLTSLLSFNVGVELGQMLVLAITIPMLDLTFRFVNDRIGIVFLSALVAHTGWHWLLERLGVLRRTPFAWPQLTPAFFTNVAAWIVGIGTEVGAVWLISGFLTKSRAGQGAEV